MTAQVDQLRRTTVVTRTRSIQPTEQESYVTRFDVHQRIQHILMISSFLTLAFTGLPQKLHMVGVSQWWIMTLGGLEMVQMIHRIAAMVMLFDGVYHVSYLTHGVLIRKKLQPLQMIPLPKDAFDMVHMAFYMFGLREERPKFGKFSYLEKFDYWAVFWGIFIIGGSGLVLMFPVFASKIVGGGIVPIALTAHSDEAVLAVAWIFIVHFFYVHLAPSVFPFNSSIFTGKVPTHRYQEEHPLDYERMQRMAAREQASAMEPVVAAAVAAEAPATPSDSSGTTAADTVRPNGQTGGTGGPPATNAIENTNTDSDEKKPDAPSD